MKTAENSETSLRFAKILIKVINAVKFETPIQLLKRKQVRVDTAIKHTVLNSEMIYLINVVTTRNVQIIGTEIEIYQRQ